MGPRRRYSLGHSLGGLIALTYLRRHPSVFDGAILSSPLLTVGSALRRRIAVGAALGRVFPGLSVPVRFNPSHLTADPDIKRTYTTDGLIVRTATLRLIREIRLAVADVELSYPAVTLPVLVLAGGRDRIADPNAARAFCRGDRRRRELVVYPDFEHEVFNERRGTAALREVLRWLPASVT